MRMKRRPCIWYAILLFTYLFEVLDEVLILIKAFECEKRVSDRCSVAMGLNMGR